jgi:uncharacterized protein YjaZ
MTVWNIHFLNARDDLTGVLPEIRAAARDAVAQVADHAELPRFDLVLRAQVEGVIPDWGLRGAAPAPGVIEIVLTPARFDPDLMVRTLVREFHHLIRRDGPNPGRSLGDALVGAGLAGHFVLQVLGGKPDPWDATAPASGLARRAIKEWSRLDFSHDDWFLGKGDIRKWSGYGLGHKLVAEFMTRNPGENAVTLAHRKADDFRAIVRQMVDGENGGAEPPEKD